MNINDNLRELIVKEINFVVNKMNESPKGEEKLFYFSGIYAMIQRILNLEYDSDLVYMHLILRETYNSLIGRLQTIKKGGDALVPLEEEHFKKLSSITKELGEKLKLKEDINNTLKKFAVLSYSTTGNGYYLQQKGLLKIEGL